MPGPEAGGPTFCNTAEEMAWREVGGSEQGGSPRCQRTLASLLLNMRLLQVLSQTVSPDSRCRSPSGCPVGTG